MAQYVPDLPDLLPPFDTKTWQTLAEIRVRALRDGVTTVQREHYRNLLALQWSGPSARLTNVNAWPTAFHEAWKGAGGVARQQIFVRRLDLFVASNGYV